ncbi:hypothetical protein [Acinetobacter phage HFM1]|nr:hypothetical protein [Acinetobacter phage HFM1]
MKHTIGSQVVLIDDTSETTHTVVSNPANVVGLSNGKFYLGREVRAITHGLNIGDRFYFFKNMKGSDSISVGYKGVVDGFWNGEIVSDDEAIFLTTEVKPLITRRAVFGCDV